MLPCDHCPQSNQYKTGIPSCALPYCPLNLKRLNELDDRITELESIDCLTAEQEKELSMLNKEWKETFMLVGGRT